MADDISLLPASVTVTFARVDTAALIPNASAAAYTVTLTSLALAEYPGLAGNPNASKVLHASAVAAFTLATDTTASNDAELLALARQAASDWYRMQAGRLDVALVGIQPWTLTSLEDGLEYVHEPAAIYTRVQRGPWEDGAEELLYHGVHGEAAQPSKGDVYYVTNIVNNVSNTINNAYVTENFYQSIINIQNLSVVNLTDVTFNFYSTVVFDIHNDFTINIDNFVTVIIQGGIFHVTNLTVNIDNTTINLNTTVVVNITQNTTVNITGGIVLQFNTGIVNIQNLIIGNTTINNNYGIWFDNSTHTLNVYYLGVTYVFNAGSSTAANVPQWTKYTVGFAAIAAGGTAFDIVVTVATLAAKQYLHAVVMKTSVAFDNGALGALELDLQTDSNILCSYPDATQAVSNTFFREHAHTAGIPGDGPFFASKDVDLHAVAVGNAFDMDDVVAGSVDVWLLVSTLP